MERRRSISIRHRGKCHHHHHTRTSSSQSFNVRKLNFIDDFKMLEASKSNKLQKHRWKFNDHNVVNRNRSSRCLRANNKNYHQSCPSTQKCDKFNENQFNDDDDNIDDQQQHTSMSRHPHRASSVKVTDWMSAKCVRKLLPIFILVNMLPFLYAGEFACVEIFQ
jgi:hypothetical protein